MSELLIKIKNYVYLIWYLILFISIYFIFDEIELDDFISHFDVYKFFFTFLLFVIGKFILTEYSFQVLSFYNSALSRKIIYKKVFFFDSFKYFPFLSGLDIASRYYDYKESKLNPMSILTEKLILYLSPIVFIFLIIYPILNILLLIFFFFKKKIITFFLLFIWFLIFGSIHSINLNIFNLDIFIDSNFARFIGYVSFFAPAGIGTREAILYSKYSTIMNFEYLVIYLTSIRVLNIIVDILFSLTSSIFFKNKC